MKNLLLFLIIGVICLVPSMSTSASLSLDNLSVVGKTENQANQTSLNLSQDEMFWLAQNIYWESKNQPKRGQALVAIVTINRMKDGRWPRTIKGVVTQPDQFSWYSDGKPDIPENKKAWKKAQKVALYVCNLYNFLSPEYKKIFYFHADYVDPSWNNRYSLMSKTKNHLFYTE